MENIENTPLTNARFSGALADEITRLNQEVKMYKTMFSLAAQDVTRYKSEKDKYPLHFEDVVAEYQRLYQQI